MELVGRGEEQARLADFVRAGAPARALVLSGEPGIGKTELWRHACRAAADAGCTVLRATAVAGESGLPYGTLGDLLAHASFEGLPSAQRQALESVTPRNAGAADPRLVAAGLLALLVAEAARAPLVIAVDDVQWVDAASATALGFALRRLDLESVRTVLVVRAGSTQLLTLAEERTEALELGPLSRGALHHLLNDRLGLSLRRPLAGRVHAVSAGNPLYALELARELERGAPSAHVGLELPTSLKAVVEARLALLPAGCVASLCTAALMEAPSLDLIDAVAPGAAKALDPALLDRLVFLDGHRIRFAHPLYAEGVVAVTPPSERRALHARLAQVVPGGPARARHRARAALGPDAETAAALEQAARDELAVGAAASAAALAADALALTVGLPPAERIVLAARAYLSAGELDQARRLLSERLCDLRPGDERARAYLLLGRSIGTNHELFDFVVAAVGEAGDPILAAEAAVALANMNIMGFVRDIPGQRLRFDEALAVLAGAGNTPGDVAAPAIWTAALAGVRDSEIDLSSEKGSTFFASAERARGLRLLWRGELNAARPIFAAGLAHARATGEDESLTSAFVQLAELEARAGRVEDATTHAAAASLGADGPESRAAVARLRAAAAVTIALPVHILALVEESVALAREGGYVWQELDARRVAGSAALLAGDAGAALAWLGPVQRHLEENGVGNPGVFPVAADLAEAHLLVGETESARRLADGLAAAGRAQEHPWALSAAARVGGLIAASDGDAALAERSLSDAAGRAGAVGLELDAARSLLALGVVRRRAKRRAEARATFEQAEAAFRRLGATHYADRAAAERARTGGRRPVDSELTETEARVAGLVAEGKTNREVAALLSLSVRGVEANLSRVYSRLGVRSRTELAARWPQPTPNGVDSPISPEPHLP